LAFIWGLIFLAQVTVFIRIAFARFNHSGQVCSGDWDYYLYEGRVRDDNARSYDPFYTKSDGEMLRWYVMFFAWFWGVGGSCFGCIFGCFLLQSTAKETTIYDSIRKPGFEEKMKKFSEQMQKR
jgi:hypothetical protein